MFSIWDSPEISVFSSSFFLPENIQFEKKKKNYSCIFAEVRNVKMGHKLHIFFVFEKLFFMFFKTSNISNPFHCVRIMIASQ